MVRIIFLGLLLTSITLNSQNRIISLWGDNIPNYQKSDEQEIIEQNDIIRIFNVAEPTLEIFLPAKKSNTGKAVVICPGGGYKSLSYDWEGTDVAKWFNSKGIAAFVLKYRLPQSKSVIVSHQAPLQDAQRAIRLLRSNAKQYHINEDQIGIMGFSAGGHLAASLGTRFDSSNNFEESTLDRVSARPNFMILLYPVVSMTESFMHKGSMINLLGKESTNNLRKSYSPELHVTENTPPTFIVHSADDLVVPVENSLIFFKALKDKHVMAEMHIYPFGGHGFGLALGKSYLTTWTDRLYDWLCDF